MVTDLMLSIGVARGTYLLTHWTFETGMINVHGLNVCAQILLSLSNFVTVRALKQVI